MVKSSRPPEVSPSAAPAPPHGVTLFDHAAIAAAIAEGVRPTRDILRERGLTEDAWNEATQVWTDRMARDAMEKGAAARVALVYSEAFGQAQDALGAPPALTPEEWAILTVEVQLEGDPAGPLAARRMSLPDYFRAVRHFARTLSRDPDADARFRATYLALHAGACAGAPST